MTGQRMNSTSDQDPSEAEQGLVLLCQPPAISDIEIDFDLPSSKELARPADFD